MNIVFFTHPTFSSHQSMPRFARMLADGMEARGHEVHLQTPQAYLVRLPLPGMLRKWLGYLDQYLIFPRRMRSRLKRYPADTLFVFTDQALGPWVPLVPSRPHVIHCHDFLAQYAALGKIPENQTGWTGRQYQAYIHRGYSQGSNFISVSQKTRDDLHQFIPSALARSEVVYNGLNQPFETCDPPTVWALLSQRTGLDLARGYLLHVGGNQWYKNRCGVIEIYNAWRALGVSVLPLLLVGESPSVSLIRQRAQSPYAEEIHFLVGIADEVVRLAYAGATAFLFPSLAEGFGWPIAEAMAAGCPVITTQEAPMTEVGAETAFYIPRRPTAGASAAWAATAANVVQQVVELCPADRQAVVAAGLANAYRFEPNAALDQIEAIYLDIVATSEKT